LEKRVGGGESGREEVEMGRWGKERVLAEVSPAGEEAGNIRWIPVQGVVQPVVSLA